MRKGQVSVPGLSVERRADDGGRAVLMVAGEVDLSTVERFRAAVESVLDDHGCLELDLRETTFMDSTGLAVLVAAYRRLGQNKEAVVVRRPTPVIRRLLDISGVGELVDVRMDASDRLRADGQVTSPRSGA